MNENNMDRLKRYVAEDWRRLGEDETWEETLFSFALVLTVFAAMFGIMELGMYIHRD